MPITRSRRFWILGSTVGLLLCVFLVYILGASAQSPVALEFNRIVYPGSFKIEEYRAEGIPRGKSRSEHWHTKDQMNQVLDYYKKLGYVFWDANHDGSTFINRTVVKNGVNISILIWSEKDGTELHLTCMDDDYILPSTFRKIVQNVVDIFK